MTTSAISPTKSGQEEDACALDDLISLVSIDIIL